MTEEELNEKTHIEALFSEWEFQNAEGIYTFDRDVMFKHCFEDAYKLGKKELETENDDIYDALNTQSLKISELEAQIEKMKQDLDNARENANKQEQWEIYSVLNDIYNDNFEVITSVSN